MNAEESGVAVQAGIAVDPVSGPGEPHGPTCTWAAEAGDTWLRPQLKGYRCFISTLYGSSLLLMLACFIYSFLTSIVCQALC